jgi:outer membrane protein OmpA-like peptidoglycan-associated protein/Tol biopolymer transport system component
MIFLGLLCGTLHAQDYVTLKNADSKLLKLYHSAQDLSKTLDYNKALERLDKALKSESRFIDALILKSEVLYSQGKPVLAIEPLEASIIIDSLYNTRNLYSLARLYEFKEDFSKAVSLLNTYIRLGNLSEKRRTDVDARIISLDFKYELVSNPVDFNPLPLPGMINTDADEALPAVTIDGMRMVFTRRESGVEDLYYSKWNDELEQWEEGIPMSSINSILNEGAHTISADGSVLAFTSCNRRKSIGSCDIYVARKLSDATWTPASNPEELNSVAWDGQPALTADGRGMYFSSSRTGGKGNRDLWYSELQTNGHWSTPVNCGETLNTKGNESSPFLHYDDRTLYFMSDGHPGMGDYDIFISSKNGKNWSPPRNIGYPINTTKREGGLSVHPNGQTAYFTIESEKGGTMEIYQFDLPKELQPAVISYLSGLVFDSDSKLPVEADISIFALQDSNEFYRYQSRSDGTFTAALSHGQPYGVHVTTPGYTFYSLQFEFDSIIPYGKQDVRIPLQKITEEVKTPHTPIILQNVEFESASSTLLPSSLTELKRLLDLLNEHSKIHIQILGHTDNVGDPKANQQLSEDRAKAVYDWLIQSEVAQNRLSYKGLGESAPIDSNTTKEGRQKNRRTEFMVRE